MNQDSMLTVRAVRAFITHNKKSNKLVLKFGELGEVMVLETYFSNERVTDFLKWLTSPHYTSIFSFKENPFETYVLLLLFSCMGYDNYQIDDTESYQRRNEKREEHVRFVIEVAMKSINLQDIDFSKIYISDK